MLRFIPLRDLQPLFTPFTGFVPHLLWEMAIKPRSNISCLCSRWEGGNEIVSGQGGNNLVCFVFLIMVAGSKMKFHTVYSFMLQLMIMVI